MSSITLSQDASRAVVVSGTNATLGVVQGSLQVDLGLRGPPGQNATGAGGAVSTTGTASVNLSGHKAVGFLANGQVALAQPGSIDPVGVTPSAAMATEQATVILAGPIDEGSWSWAPGYVYLGADGTLTQVPPVTGEVHVLGESAGPTRLVVSPRHVATLTP